jgi:O-antigen ligase
MHHVLATGSRGALVAIAATALFIFWRGTMRQRIIITVLVPITIVAAGALLSKATLERITAFSDEGTTDIGALYSKQTREYLLRQSIRFSFQRPVFGVGPGQFQNFEGQASREEGRRGAWLSTHNMFTQVSSEFGLPGLILFVAVLIGTFRIFNEVLREARQRQLEEFSFAVLCLLISFVAFSVAATFLNLAYGFYFPAFTGLAVAVYSALHMDPELASGVRYGVRPFAQLRGGPSRAASGARRAAAAITRRLRVPSAIGKP